MKTSLSVLALLTVIGCGGTRPQAVSNPKPVPPAETAASNIQFENATASSGIDFKLGHNGKSPLTILETTGGGAAFLDYDGDGWPDILLVGPYNFKLYHNDHHGKFKDVSAQTDIPADKYWMGCAVGDYDGDGKPDIFLTGYRCFGLFHNEGSGKFRDVTAQSGITDLPWSMSAAFADLDGDGKLDLFVAQYINFNEKSQQLCEVGSTKSACGPEVYDSLSGHRFINLGNGKFRKDESWKDTGKTWGVLVSDLLGNGKPSIYLANDMMPGDMWTSASGKWKNEGPSSGTAFDAQGHVQGGMGVDSADYDNDGKLDLIVTTFFAQSKSLYHNDGNGLFTETGNRAHIGPATMPYVGFGCSFADFDNDGWQDLIITNGHVRDNVHVLDASQTYEQPIQVFSNSKGIFDNVSSLAGAIKDIKIVGRGLAVGDYDRDGKLDVIICNLEGQAVLLHNVSNAGHWLEVDLQDSGPNRLGSGALITLKQASQTLIREARTSGTVLSAQMARTHFGLGSNSNQVSLSVRWPDGKTTVFNHISPNQLITINRQKGLLKTGP